jgi:putative peptidoglycan lipid II flippase
VCIIGCALFLSPQLEEPIVGVAIGVVAGGAAQFLMQIPSLKARGFLFGIRFQPGHPGVKRIGRLMLPSLLGLSVTQVNLTISTILASFITGAPTYLFYGMRLVQFPLGIFGVALAMAILPTLSAQAARGAMEELRTTFGFGLRMIVFIMFPAMLGLICLRTPIVHVFFEHGTFTAHDTAETALALLCYAVGLWAFGGVRIIVAAFYSLQDTTTPAISGAIGASDGARGDGERNHFDRLAQPSSRRCRVGIGRPFGRTGAGCVHSAGPVLPVGGRRTGLDA